MNEMIARITAEISGAWRFRNWAVGFAWAIAIAGWIWVLLLPNSYEAKARVYIDTQSVLRPLLTGLAVGTDVETDARMVSTLVLSRPNLEKVARSTDLYLRASTPNDLERMIQGLSRRIIMQSARDNTYSIAFSDHDPQMAQRVVQKLLNTFVEDTLGVKRADTTSALKFLEGQIKEYEQKLREAEDRLADFQKQNVGLMPGQGGDYYTRLQAAIVTLEELRSKLRLAHERSDDIEAQLEGEAPSFGIAPSPGQPVGTQTGTDGKIAEYKARLDALLLQYTEKHPEVIALRGTIEDLEQKRASEQAARQASGRREPSSGSSLNMNPVYQSMRIALSRAEVEVGQLETQVAEQDRLVRELRGRINTIPEVEAQLSRLNRDYEINRAQYQALVQRLESGRLSENVEHSTEKVKFRIIDPPLVPRLASGPNRPLLLSIVLGLAIALAAALAYFLHMVRPVFMSRASLREISGLPVLGSVSLFRSPQGIEGLLARPIAVAAGFALLIGVFAITLALSAAFSGPTAG